MWYFTIHMQDQVSGLRNFTKEDTEMKILLTPKLTAL